MEIIITLGIIVISWILSDIKIELSRSNNLKEQHNKILKDYYKQ